MKQNTLLSYSAFLAVANAKCDPMAIQASLPSGATVNFARTVAANGTFEVAQSQTGYPTSPKNLPSLCAVSVQVQSIGNTTYGFGMFLPDDWNGRFLAVGNGGFAGGINYLDMVGQIQQSSMKAVVLRDDQLLMIFRLPAHATGLQQCQLTRAITLLHPTALGRIISPTRSRIGAILPCTALL